MASVQFDTHLPNLLREMVEGHPHPGPLTRAVNLTMPILRQLAARAIEIDDPHLNILMLRLAMYEIDPSKRLMTIAAQQHRIASEQTEMRRLETALLEHFGTSNATTYTAREAGRVAALVIRNHVSKTALSANTKDET